MILEVNEKEGLQPFQLMQECPEKEKAVSLGKETSVRFCRCYTCFQFDESCPIFLFSG